MRGSASGTPRIRRPPPTSERGHRGARATDSLRPLRLRRRQRRGSRVRRRAAQRGGHAQPGADARAASQRPADQRRVPRPPGSAPLWSWERSNRAEPCRRRGVLATGSDRGCGYDRRVVRLASWIRPAGGSPAPVGAGAPGGRPRSRGEIPAAERGVRSLFGASKRVGWDCSLVRSTVGEPSRSCHGEGDVRQSWLRIGLGGSLRGRETCTRARSDHGTREIRLASLVSKDRSYESMAKASGARRESGGVVVVMIGVQNNALVAKGPCFGHACRGGKR